MLDFIGLFIGAGILLGLSAGVSVIILFLTWLVVRPMNLWRAALLVPGALLAPACVAWLYLSVALLPHESLFGDIDQPLPNGYRLQALGKMPDFATIDSGSGVVGNQAHLSECIGSLQVQNNWIAGRYSHPFGTFEAMANEPYFLFNTHTGIERDFPTRDALQAQLPDPLQLEPVTAFESQEPAYRCQHLLSRFVITGPMIAAASGYVLLILVIRRRGHAAHAGRST